MASLHFNPGIFRELANRPPDFVILDSYEQPTCLYAGLVLGRMGVPFLLGSEAISLEDSVVGRRAPFLVRKLVRRSAGVIVPGRASREHALDLGMHSDRVFVAPNAVDVQRFAPAPSLEVKRAMRGELGLPQGKTLCLSVGRLLPTKGFDDVLDAFEAMPRDARNPHLLIAGDGPLRQTMEKRVAQNPCLRESVSIVGYVPEELLPKYYMASDIFVFPTRRDIWGLVLNEAMAAGLACVSSDAAAATQDLIDDGINGVVVPAGEPRKLQEAVVRLHEDPILRDRMGRLARQGVLEHFTPEKQAMGYLQAIFETLRRLGRLEHDAREAPAHG
jgi:glycosyltransferase involved in cell wall biosynthesis